tara:strand:- start:418 stop:618 length:201 start_codon:yes stop_codon:yes gene_type:complete
MKIKKNKSILYSDKEVKLAIKRVKQQHNKLRKILIKYNNPEFGDCIIDEICELFIYPTTLIYDYDK